MADSSGMRRTDAPAGNSPGDVAGDLDVEDDDDIFALSERERAEVEAGVEPGAGAEEEFFGIGGSAGGEFASDEAPVALPVDNLGLAAGALTSSSSSALPAPSGSITSSSQLMDSSVALPSSALSSGASSAMAPPPADVGLEPVACSSAATDALVGGGVPSTSAPGFHALPGIVSRGPSSLVPAVSSLSMNPNRRPGMVSPQVYTTGAFPPEAFTNDPSRAAVPSSAVVYTTQVAVVQHSVPVTSVAALSVTGGGPPDVSMVASASGGVSSVPSLVGGGDSGPLLDCPQAVGEGERLVHTTAAPPVPSGSSCVQTPPVGPEGSSSLPDATPSAPQAAAGASSSPAPATPTASPPAEGSAGAGSSRASPSAPAGPPTASPDAPTDAPSGGAGRGRGASRGRSRGSSRGVGGSRVLNDLLNIARYRVV